MANVQRTTILPPLLGIRMAWELTSQYSADSNARDKAQDTRQKLSDLESEAKAIANTPEGRYVLGALALIRSSERTLQIIMEGRNLNFKEEDELRRSSQENILYFSQVSNHLQSMLPRLGSMAVVGSAGSITLAQIFGEALKDYPNYLFPLIIALAVGIGYLLHGLVVVPIVKRLLQKDKIRADYDRNLYYDQYFERSRNALLKLYVAIDEYHLAIFGNKYYTKSDSRKIVEDSIMGVGSTMCEHVHKHMNEDKVITADLWPMCESGQGVTSCKWWKKEPRV